MRSVAVEAKLACEAQLRARLEALRAENRQLEEEVKKLDARARAVKHGIESKVRALGAAGAEADKLGASP